MHGRNPVRQVRTTHQWTKSTILVLTLNLAMFPQGVQNMNGMIANVRRFLSSEDGPTAVEYAVMLALIVVACVTVVKNLGSSISGTFSSVSSAVGS
jgi:pilus assembly protein Flp/PilA